MRDGPINSNYYWNQQVGQAEIVDFIVDVLVNSHASLIIKQQCLTALAKLTTRGFDSQSE